jgi:glyoxylase-like metal-dependent hydrolase (beta-lactamase superfamily II)
VSFFYLPDRILFAGDALAVIDGRIRFMARPVTLHLDQARESLRRCIALRPNMICPGHREPLTANVLPALDAMQQHLDSGGAWPLLG